MRKFTKSLLTLALFKFKNSQCQFVDFARNI